MLFQEAMAKIDTVKLRGVERLFHLDDEVGIAKRVGRLRKEKNAAGLGEAGKTVQLQKGKEERKI